MAASCDRLPGAGCTAKLRLGSLATYRGCSCRRVRRRSTTDHSPYAHVFSSHQATSHGQANLINSGAAHFIAFSAGLSLILTAFYEAQRGNLDFWATVLFACTVIGLTAAALWYLNRKT
jgi:hypothetical protein